MDQSYFRFLFQLARKSKQSGLSRSAKCLAKRNVTLIVLFTCVHVNALFWKWIMHLASLARFWAVHYFTKLNFFKMQCLEQVLTLGKKHQLIRSEKSLTNFSESKERLFQTLLMQSITVLKSLLPTVPQVLLKPLKHNMVKKTQLTGSKHKMAKAAAQNYQETHLPSYMKWSRHGTMSQPLDKPQPEKIAQIWEVTHHQATNNNFIYFKLFVTEIN